MENIYQPPSSKKKTQPWRITVFSLYMEGKKNGKPGQF